MHVGYHASATLVRVSCLKPSNGNGHNKRNFQNNLEQPLGIPLKFKMHVKDSLINCIKGKKIKCSGIRHLSMLDIIRLFTMSRCYYHLVVFCVTLYGEDN